METEIIKKPMEEKLNEKSISPKKSSEQKNSLSEKLDTKEIKISEKQNKEETTVHKAKAETVTKLSEKIKNSKTLMIVSIKNLPSKQFQSIKKSLRGEALVKVAKKNIMLRVIKKFGKESILGLEKEIQENCAFVISDIEGFELAGILSKEKTPASAKAGQIAPEDIEVKAGPTSLVPGPAISELGALGIQISIDEGKISIKSPKVIIRKDGIINEGAASILQKLDIHPFSVGLEPLAVYDVQTEKIYADIKIDSEETIKELKTAAGKALGFAQKIIYYCKDTISYLLAKANAQANKLGGLAPKEEPKTEEVKEETESISPQELNDKEDISKDNEVSDKDLDDKKESTEKSSEQPITDTKEDSNENLEETKNE